MQVSQHIGAGNDPHQLAILEHWQTANVPLHHQPLDLRQGRVGGEGLDVGSHVALDGGMAKAVVQGNVDISPRDHSHQAALAIHHHQAGVAIAQQHPLRLLDSNLRSDGAHRRGHQILGRHRRRDPLFNRLAEVAQHLGGIGQGLVWRSF